MPSASHIPSMPTDTPRDGSPAPSRRATAGVVEYARKTISPTIVCRIGRGDAEAGERHDAQVADERGIHDEEERLGDERAERGHGEAQDVAIEAGRAASARAVTASSLLSPRATRPPLSPGRRRRPRRHISWMS